MSRSRTPEWLSVFLVTVIATFVAAWFLQDARFKPIPKITVVNELLMPISIEVDGLYKGEIAPQSKDEYVINGNAATVNYTIKRMRYESGEEFGELISGTIAEVLPGEVARITNQVGDRKYYYAEINSNMATFCDVAFNIESLDTQAIQTTVSIEPYQRRYGVGYFSLAPYSNICNAPHLSNHSDQLFRRPSDAAAPRARL